MWKFAELPISGALLDAGGGSRWGMTCSLRRRSASQAEQTAGAMGSRGGLPDGNWG